jgi:hypothetical protein
MNCTLSIVEHPRYGSLIREDNWVVYVPDGDFSGIDTFAYRLDGLGRQPSAPAIVSLHVPSRYMDDVNQDAQPQIDPAANDDEAAPPMDIYDDGYHVNEPVDVPIEADVQTQSDPPVNGGETVPPSDSGEDVHYGGNPIGVSIEFDLGVVRPHPFIPPCVGCAENTGDLVTVAVDNLVMLNTNELGQFSNRHDTAAVARVAPVRRQARAERRNELRAEAVDRHLADAELVVDSRLARRAGHRVGRGS